ncbi:MAG: intradiol ring-cleavage dioxygenase [Pyrinomonadaceae bacterium]
MNAQKSIQLIAILLLQLFVCCSSHGQTTPANTKTQTERVGGECEAGYCELIYFGMPKDIKSVDTSPGWNEKGQKLIVTGTVFQVDGKTPAPNVIIYYHQTDSDGYYSPRNDKPENQTRHGHVRGWVKTDKNGKYTINTIRPAPYPNDVIPAHIHLMVKEPDIANEYWLDDLVFDDDKLLIPYRKKYPALAPRGGSGTLFPLLKGDLQIAEHDIILGLNIPNYPGKQGFGDQSGRNIGENQPSFSPFHAFGSDKGTQACPVCKYGRFHGILYFVGNNPNWGEIKKWLAFLDKESLNRRQHLKVYFVYGDEKDYSSQNRQKELEKLGQELNIKNVALTFVPSFSDTETNVYLNKINPLVENTFIIFRQRTIVDKYIGLKPTEQNFRRMSETLDKTKGDYFDLSEPAHR